MFKCLRLHNDAILPKRATPGSVGFDLHSYYDIVVPSMGSVVVGTGVCIEMPAPDHKFIGARILSRSGLAKQGIDVAAGLIDNDYRGEIKVLLRNTNSHIFVVTKGMRIAQLVFIEFAVPELVETIRLSDTQRGSGGFGSTGV